MRASCPRAKRAGRARRQVLNLCPPANPLAVKFARFKDLERARAINKWPRSARLARAEIKPPLASARPERAPICAADAFCAQTSGLLRPHWPRARPLLHWPFLQACRRWASAASGSPSSLAVADDDDDDDDDYDDDVVVVDDDDDESSPHILVSQALAARSKTLRRSGASCAQVFNICALTLKQKTTTSETRRRGHYSRSADRPDASAGRSRPRAARRRRRANGGTDLKAATWQNN